MTCVPLKASLNMNERVVYFEDTLGTKQGAYAIEDLTRFYSCDVSAGNMITFKNSEPIRINMHIIILQSSIQINVLMKFQFLQFNSLFDQSMCQNQKDIKAY